GAERAIAWDLGPEGWVTLNSDRSVDLTRRKAAASGLLRDEAGRCLFAFTMNLGSCSITRAESRGALEGLHRCWEAGFRNIILQLDSMAALSLLLCEAEVEHQHAMEILTFNELRSRNWTINVKHTYREGNHAADYVASYGYPRGVTRFYLGL
ncbi:Putative ribonuclease H protein At1g65750, partial [Linum perenne]